MRSTSHFTYSFDETLLRQNYERGLKENGEEAFHV